MSMKGNNIDESVLRRVDEGDINAITQEQVQCLLNIYPKEAEIKLLVTKLDALGLKSFKSALDCKELQCGWMEQFMLRMLESHTDLKQKAEIILEIQQVGSKLGELKSRINCWHFVQKELC